jgi:pre-mRNA-processing factor 39
MPFKIDLSDIPNKDLWLPAAKEAASNPDNFKLWQHLIDLTEYLPSIKLKSKFKINENSPKILKKLVLLVYENLLINFPFLEKYWINYALWFHKFNKLEKSIETFERALNILPNSLIIWNSYIDLRLIINFDNYEMISHFETARISIGYHYYSSLFFDKYLLFLKNNNFEKETHLLLRKIIEIPQHEYLKYFKMFLSLLENSNLKTIKYLISKNDLQNDYGFKWVDLLKAENFDKLKIELKKKFLDIFITIQYMSWKFYNFEEKLSTNYFLPNSNLNRLELTTWKSYIEFVENLNLKLATKEREVFLIKNNTFLIDSIYNRCLTATALYPIFWIKLSNYYLNYNDLESAKKVLLRGIYMNPIQNLKLRLRLIDIYIISIEFDKAKAIIFELLQLLPNNYEIFIKLLEVEHFTLPSNVEKLIINKLNEISKLKNYEIENQFDYLFIEMLNFSSIPLTKLNKIFEQFKYKKSPHYLKGRRMFNKFYNTSSTDDHILKVKNVPIGWECEYF